MKRLTVTQENVFRKSTGKSNEQNRNNYEQADIFSSVDFGHDQDGHIWVLIWLHKNNAKLCYTDTESFVIQIKLEDIHADISRDVDGKIWYTKL